MGSPKRPIQAILVFKDPEDWYLDLQIMMDVIMGGAPQGFLFHSNMCAQLDVQGMLSLHGKSRPASICLLLQAVCWGGGSRRCTKGNTARQCR